jgi:hypothetical protein
MEKREFGKVYGGTLVQGFLFAVSFQMPWSPDAYQYIKIMCTQPFVAGALRAFSIGLFWGN